MYPNTEYLNSIKMSKIEFERMCKMSSWATCSAPKSLNTEEGNAEEEEDEHEKEMDEDNADQTS
jgi:tRNA:m4X modification enzyme